MKGFNKNVLIATPKGYVKISKLKKNDSIWSFNNDFKIVKKHVGKINKTQDDEIYRIEIKNYVIFVGGEQKWLRNDGQHVQTKDLKKGDEIMEITQRELRSINNVARRDWMKKILSKNMKKTNKSGKIHWKLPQNNKGYKHGESFKLKAKQSALKRWQSKKFQKAWKSGFMNSKKIYKNRPTKLEIKFMMFFENNDIDIKYVGDGKLWIERYNPDFKINGQKKIIEVYTKKMPWETRDRRWITKRKLKMKEWKILFIDVSELKNTKKVLHKINTFIHNGLIVKNISKIKKNVNLFSIEGCDNYFAYRCNVSQK